jgi:hypothetical protein
LRAWTSEDDNAELLKKLKQAVKDTQVLSHRQIWSFYRMLELNELARDIQARFLILSAA